MVEPIREEQPELASLKKASKIGSTMNVDDENNKPLTKKRSS